MQVWCQHFDALRPAAAGPPVPCTALLVDVMSLAAPSVAQAESGAAWTRLVCRTLAQLWQQWARTPVMVLSFDVPTRGPVPTLWCPPTPLPPVPAHVFPLSAADGLFQVGPGPWCVREPALLLNYAPLEWQLRRQLVAALVDGQLPVPAGHTLLLDNALWFQDEAAHTRLRAHVEHKHRAQLDTVHGRAARATALAVLTAHYTYTHCCTIELGAGQAPVFSKFAGDAKNAGDCPEALVRLLNMAVPRAVASPAPQASFVLVSRHPDAFVAALTRLLFSPALAPAHLFLVSNDDNILYDLSATAVALADATHAICPGRVLALLFLLLARVSVHNRAAVPDASPDVLWFGLVVPVACGHVRNVPWLVCNLVSQETDGPARVHVAALVSLLELLTQRLVEQERSLPASPVLLDNDHVRGLAGHAVLSTTGCLAVALRAHWLLEYYGSEQGSSAAVAEAMRHPDAWGWRHVTAADASFADAAECLGTCRDVRIKTHSDGSVVAHWLRAADSTDHLLTPSPSLTDLRASSAGLFST